VPVTILEQAEVEAIRATKEGAAMKTAAIYCRVSTEDQEREGTSLQTQLEACREYCQGKGYDVAHPFSETFSGLTLDRPILNELRELVRADKVDIIVVYCLDRLSRDPTHGVILTQEFEKHSVILEAVTEDIDNSELGKLISYIRGFASKLEAEKIRERTMRGKRARAAAGRLPANSHARLYGYTYIPGKGAGEGVRYVNENEARWIREMFRWLVEDNISTSAITSRLRDLGVPTSSGKGFWLRSTVHGMLKNPAYTGKTYCFGGTMEIPGATPPIIASEIFEAAQSRLKHLRQLYPRYNKNDYLLHGHLYCARCGRAYWGNPGVKPRNGKMYRYPFYLCSGKTKKVTPVACDNRQHNANRLEDAVWAKVSKVLRQPELVFAELQQAHQDNSMGLWQKELDRLNNLLRNRQRQKDRVWKAFEITGDEGKFREDIATIEKEISQLGAERDDVEARVKSSHHLVHNADNIRQTCDLVAQKLDTLDYEGRRLALQALQIKVLVDGDAIEVKGAIPLNVEHAVSTASGWNFPDRSRES
jgi:site-specific DNA recombinase